MTALLIVVVALYLVALFCAFWRMTADTSHANRYSSGVVMFGVVGVLASIWQAGWVDFSLVITFSGLLAHKIANRRMPSIFMAARPVRANMTGEQFDAALAAWEQTRRWNDRLSMSVCAGGVVAAFLLMRST